MSFNEKLNCVPCTGEACCFTGEFALYEETCYENIFKLQACGNLPVQNFWCFNPKSFRCFIKGKHTLKGLLCAISIEKVSIRLICQILAGFLQLFFQNYRVAATLKLAKGRDFFFLH